MPRQCNVLYLRNGNAEKYYHTVKDFSMLPLLHPDDEIEFVPGRPEPDGRVCLVQDGKRHRVCQACRESKSKEKSAFRFFTQFYINPIQANIKVHR